MQLSNQKKDRAEYNLHSIFSVVDHYLIAQCLDISTTSRIDLFDIISESTKSSEELSNEIMRNIFENHALDIMNHIISCNENEIAYPFTHTSEKYWKEFRKIRMVRDNYSFNIIHGRSTSGIEPFIDLKNKIKNTIDDLNPTINGSYKVSFIQTISAFREVA